MAQKYSVDRALQAKQEKRKYILPSIAKKEKKNNTEACFLDFLLEKSGSSKIIQKVFSFHSMLDLFGALWNLFLLALPVMLCFVFLHKWNDKKWQHLSFLQKCTLVLLIILFLLLFPNIPYLFTDARHIMDYCSGDDLFKRCPEAPWALMVYFTYTTLAIPFFVFSIKTFSRFLANIFAVQKLEMLTPLFLIPLAALGVCLGLFERWNSWNALNNPLLVIESALSYFLVYEKFQTLFVFSCCLSIIFFVFSHTQKIK